MLSQTKRVTNGGELKLMYTAKARREKSLYVPQYQAVCVKMS